MTHPLFGAYTVQRYPYKIIFSDGVEYTKKESIAMSGLSDLDKKQIHMLKLIFEGEMQ